jgi:hypothetical protein
VAGLQLSINGRFSVSTEGVAGTTMQLRFEYTQDRSGTCASIRPGHTCGVFLDNVVINSVVSNTP